MALKDTLDRAMNDEVDVDFSGAREGGFGPIEPGDYNATVIECSADVVKNGDNKGAPKVVFKFRINDGEAHAGRVFFKHCVTKGEGAGILRDVLRSLGANTDELRKVKPSAYVNKQCIINVRFQKNSPEQQEVGYTKAAKGTKLSASTAKKVDGRTAKRATASTTKKATPAKRAGSRLR